MSRRNFFSSGPLGGSQPTAHLAGRPRARLGQQGGNGCVVPGTQERPVFQYNPTTKVCGVSWMDPSTAQYPDCVQAPPDYLGGGYNGWIPPSCMPSPELTPTPTPTESLPPGLACPMGNGLFTLLNYATGEIIAENITRDQFSQYTDNVTDLSSDMACSDDSRCAPICNVSVVEPPPEPYYGEPPVTAPTPTPVAPPVTKVSPGASVPIASGPFPSVAPSPSIPIMPGRMPSSAPPLVPQKGFAPATIRPSCQVTKYKTHMFPAKTTPTRPDAFADRQQWTS